MNFCIHLAIREVVNSAQKVLGEKTISLHKEIDSNLPVCVRGKQLILTHVLHTLIDDAKQYLAKGKLTIRANVLSQKNGILIVGFIVAYTGSLLNAVSSDGARLAATGNNIERTKRLINSEGGSFEEASTPEVGKQYRFSLKYHYEEAQASQPTEASFRNALFSLSKMFSPPAIKKALT